MEWGANFMAFTASSDALISINSLENYPSYLYLYSMTAPKEKSFLKRHGSNILLVIFILLMIIPQTRKPIQVAVNRIFAFGPSEIAEEKREVLTDYDWQLNILGGGTANFSEAKGEVIILNFWATWCPPCVAEMPSFQKLYDDYGDKVEFYFVSQENEEPLNRFLEKRGLDVPVYRSLTYIPEQLVSNSLPTTYVISRSGEIVVKKTGAADWNTKDFRELLEELLKES